MLSTCFVALAFLLQLQQYFQIVVANGVVCSNAPYRLNDSIQSCHSINKYLVEAAQHLNDPKDKTVVFVIGHEGSYVSPTNGALAYAYHMEHMYAHSEDKQYVFIPIVNFNLKDWNLKLDVRYHLETTMRIKHEHLQPFFIDQIKKNHPEKLENARIVLIDFYESSDPRLIKDANVVHIIDHHRLPPGWSEKMAHVNKKNIDNEITRTTASLIARQIRQDFDIHPIIKQTDKDNHVYNGIFELLLAPMLADNSVDVIFGNAIDKNGNVKNEVDKKMFKYVMNNLPYGAIDDDLIEKLKAYKMYLQSLELSIDEVDNKGQLCNKYFKAIWPQTDLNRRVCIPQFPISAVHYLKNMDSIAMDELRKFANDKDCEVIVLMGKENNLRDLGIVAIKKENDPLAKAIADAIENDEKVFAPKTQMTKEWKEMGGDVLDPVRIMPNRAGLLPIIQGVLDSGI